jgi:hypothetical protein
MMPRPIKPTFLRDFFGIYKGPASVRLNWTRPDFESKKFRLPETNETGTPRLTAACRFDSIAWDQAELSAKS